MWELITERVISCAVGQLVSHQVDDVGGGADEDDLHARVIHTHEVHKEVDVAYAEDKQVDLLSLA